MARVLIIDDEPNVRELISYTLKNVESVELVGEAASVEAGLEAIRNYQPDIVLLDVHLPDGTGFDLLRHIERIKFKVIFITAHQEYSIQAFKFSAIDYLLKPFSPEELEGAIKRALLNLHKDFNLSMEVFNENIKNTIPQENKRLVLKTTENIFVLTIKEIIRCESDGAYTRFFLTDGRKILVSKILKEYDELLQNYNFFRVHQSHLINIEYMETFNKLNGGFVIMKDKSSVPVSSRKKESLLKLIDRL